MAPPFKFGTVPYGSTETNLMTHYPSIYGYMRKYSKANAIEGVKAVKDGSVLVLLFSLQLMLVLMLMNSFYLARKSCNIVTTAAP